jgi:hypothetical protein
VELVGAAGVDWLMEGAVLRSGDVRTIDGDEVYTGSWSVVRGKLHMVCDHGARSADIRGFERSPRVLARLLLSGLATELRPRRSAGPQAAAG